MKTTEGAKKVSAAKTAAPEPAATDKENLVGAGRTLKSTAGIVKGDLKKNEMSSDKVISNDVVKKKKNVTMESKSVQTGRDYKEIEIPKEDLTSEAGPSENYWEVIAERRRIALSESVAKIEELYERVNILEDENRIYKEQLDECKALIEVLKEMLGEDETDINQSLDDTI